MMAVSWQRLIFFLKSLITVMFTWSGDLLDIFVHSAVVEQPASYFCRLINPPRRPHHQFDIHYPMSQCAPDGTMTSAEAEVISGVRSRRWDPRDSMELQVVRIIPLVQ